MLPADVLLNILEFVNRENLEKLQVTSRAINQIISRDFASKPLRVLDAQAKVEMSEAGKLVLALVKPPSIFFVPKVGWQKTEEKLYFPIEDMRPYFAPPYIRVLTNRIYFRDDMPFTVDHIRELETICHIWDGRRLRLFDQKFPLSKTSNSISLMRMCQSPTLLKCRYLHNEVLDFSMATGSGLLQNLNVNTAQFVEFQYCDAKCILDWFRLKAEFPESDTILKIQVYSQGFDEQLNLIRQEFLASVDPCLLKMVIIVLDSSKEHNYDTLLFPVENQRTKEVLQLQKIDDTEANKSEFKLDADNFDGFRSALLLNRFMA